MANSDFSFARIARQSWIVYPVVLFAGLAILDIAAAVGAGRMANALFLTLLYFVCVSGGFQRWGFGVPFGIAALDFLVNGSRAIPKAHSFLDVVGIAVFGAIVACGYISLYWLGMRAKLLKRARNIYKGA